VEQRLSCIRVTPGRLVGTHPWKAGVRERSGAAVVAVERAGKVLIELAADFRLRADDIVVICGSGASLDQFMLAFQAAPSASAPSR
jgi:Trk K+ transport system NAD-binding subunit